MTISEELIKNKKEKFEKMGIKVLGIDCDKKILSICAWCSPKKYLKESIGEFKLSHGICNECDF